MTFHPDLAFMARLLPRGVVRRWSVGLLSRLPIPALRHRGITIEQRTLPGTSAKVRILRGPPRATPRPVVLWIHGGGYVIGGATQDDATCARMVQELDAVVVSVDYRLASHTPFPAALDDCEAAYDLLLDDASALGIDPTRIIIAGQSAGGGLAACLAQRLLDRAVPLPLLQVLVYPMLDDRTVLRHTPSAHYRLWDPTSNHIGWSRYLGQEPGADHVPDYAVAARRRDLQRLPPVWMGVGTLDLFHDEDVAYATRLRAAGVVVQLELVPGAFHGFEAVAPYAPVSEAFVQSRIDAMRRAFETANASV